MANGYIWPVLLTADHDLLVYVDGQLAGQGKATGMLGGDPAEPLEIGADEGSNVGDYLERCAFTGLIDEVRLFHRALSAEEVHELAAGTQDALAHDPALVLAFSFDQGDATDQSDQKNTGTVEGAMPTAGRIGKAMRFAGGGNRVAGYTVVHHWTEDLPFFARAMVLADGTLFVAGPPDVMNEETAFRRISDPRVQEQLMDQLASVNGRHGAILRAVSAVDGQTRAEYKLDVPPVFDGMAAAGGRLYLSAIDGSVRCWKSN